mgnify:CR=1 FL=1|jgi:hypothetical protein
MQNLLYALIQSVHNIGAVVIVAVGAYGLFFSHERYKGMLAGAQAIAWAVQGVSGGVFGLTSFYFYHQLPDIHGVAIVALLIKIGCVVSGFSISTMYVIWGNQFSPSLQKMAWTLMFATGSIALSSAAFLRWFS